MYLFKLYLLMSEAHTLTRRGGGGGGEGGERKRKEKKRGKKGNTKSVVI